MTDSDQHRTRRLQLNQEHLFDMVVSLQSPLAVGDTPKGNRQILLGESGEFQGRTDAGANSTGWRRLVSHPARRCG